MTIQLGFMAFHAYMTASIFFLWIQKIWKTFSQCKRINPAPKGILNVSEGGP